MSPVIECINVCKHYPQGNEDLVVLDQVSFQVNSAETIAIIGSSGAGKSTLLNLLGGLDQPTKGQVKINGALLKGQSETALAQMRNRHIGFVYQFHHLLGEFNALENTAMPLLIRGEKKAEAYRQAEQLLLSVGLTKRINHRPYELSGGERQRVAIARALVGKPSCVLMDEPTGNLDEHTADQVQALLQNLNQQLNIAFVIVTHDKRIADNQQRQLFLHEGHLVEIE